ncbi:MAG: zinc-dependent alcohol dehydrogenase [Terriglobia bacterium]
MNALVLEDVGRFRIREIPTPIPKEKEVLIQVGTVGICGTDLHIFHGLANYTKDEGNQPIPLNLKPQILGHEFCGRVEALGPKVTHRKCGELVVVDQVLNCISQGRSPICEYCETGDSHQCAFGQELGITGPPGAFADYVVAPEVNVVPLPPGLSPLKGAIIEPLGCILHASSRMEHAQNRYTFDGTRRIQHILILGAGPSGLLFLQYLRNVKKFDGDIWVADMHDTKLAVAKKLGGTPLDIRKRDPVAEIKNRTRGEGIHYLIEATGSGSVFEWIPSLVRRQGTILFYGAGHSGKDISCLTPFQVFEFGLVTSAGASGNFDKESGPEIYRRAMEYVQAGDIDAESLFSHRYTKLEQLQSAFSDDFRRGDFIKGVLNRDDVA